MASAAPAAGAVYVANGGLLDPLLVSADSHIGAAKKAGHGAKGKHWAAADKAERRVAKESGGEDGRALLFRSYKVKGSLLHPYRYASSARFAIFFVHADNY
jgi:mixed-linked glucan synthase